MPIYEYTCAKCGSVSEFLTGVSQEESVLECSSCGSAKLTRKLSVISINVGGAKAEAPCGAGPGETCPHCQHA